MHATFIRSTNRQGALKTVTINVRKVFTEKRSNCVKRGLNTYQGTCKENSYADYSRQERMSLLSNVGLLGTDQCHGY